MGLYGENGKEHGNYYTTVYYTSRVSGSSRGKPSPSVEHHCSGSIVEIETTLRYSPLLLKFFAGSKVHPRKYLSAASLGRASNRADIDCK